MSEMMKAQNNHMFNKEVTPDTHLKMSTNIRKTLFDLIIRTKLSRANSTTKNLNFGKIVFTEILTKMSAAQGTTIFVYDSNNSFVNTFSSVKEIRKYFNCSFTTIKKYTLIG
jgi:hypothetical protein